MGTIVNKTTLQYFGEKFLENLDSRYGYEEGKVLSSNDFTTTEKNKLAEKIASYTGLKKDFILSRNLRVTSEEFSHELCFRFQKPIVSTSANISGEPTPQTFEEISEEIKEAVDYVVKYSRQSREKHKPSSIIKMNANGQFTIIRE